MKKCDVIIDKVQDDIDKLSEKVSEAEKNLVDIEGSIKSLRSKENLLLKKDEIKTIAIIKGLKIIFKVLAIGALPVALISIILSLNILIPEMILFLVSFLTGGKVYLDETEEIRNLSKSTTITKIKSDIEIQERKLYRTNQSISLNQKEINEKKQRLKNLTLQNREKLNNDELIDNNIIVLSNPSYPVLQRIKRPASE